jgi:ParB family chromosome partitioning protein
VAKEKAKENAPKRAPARRAPRRKPALAPVKGLLAAETREVPAAEVRPTVAAVEAAGGAVLATYREPLGGHPIVLAALPVDRVAPTPYQRDLSPMHVKRLEGALRAIDRFLDPIVAVVAEGGGFWTPNGNHRLAAMREVGAQAITALVVPEPETAFKILALNTEKAHALRDKALEVVRMARALAGSGRREAEHAVEFEEPAFLTLGVCYESNGRFPGGAYQSVLKRTERFLDRGMPEAIAERERRAKRLMALEEKVAAVVAALKARGLQSPYLRAFVVARINPLRWSKEESPDLDKTLDEMERKASKMDASKISPQDVARSGGAPDAGEE